jgi:hypothetical protein
MLVRGPAASSGEKTVGKSHQPRDFGFELLIASLFVQAGFGVDLDQVTDVIATKDRQSFFAECKRPRRENSLSSAIKSAASQLTNRLDSGSNRLSDFGLIAVAVDLILHQKQDILIVPNLESMEAALKGTMRDLVSSYNSSWLKIKQPQILGVLLVLQVSTVFLDSHTLTRCSYVVGNNIVGISTVGGGIFKNIINQLGSAILRIQ